MAGIEAGQLKRGLAIMLENVPHLLVGMEFVKPGKGQALYKCRLKNLNTGSQFDRTYRSGERFEVADVEDRDIQFLYREGEYFHFMNSETYEQYQLHQDDVGEAQNFLVDSMVVKALLFDGRPIGIELPNFVVLEVTQSEAWIKGDTASGATKPVEVASGYTVQVPLFIKQGEFVKIDTRTGDYVERVNK